MDDVQLEKPPLSLRSPVWEHFGFPVSVDIENKRKVDKETVVCRKCRYKTKYTGSTTNMAVHLKRHHQEIAGRSRSPSPQPLSKLRTMDPNSSQQGQQLLSNTFRQPLAHTSARSCKISRAVADFIAVDMRPYSVVESVGFRRLVQILEPRYVIPSRTHFSTKLIPQIYSDVKNEVMLAITEAEFIALTTDGWTSRVVESYVTVTAHFVTDEWKIANFVLQTKAVSKSHTSENLGEELSNTAKEWGLTRLGGKIPVVTDNASNMDGAVRTANMGPNIKCFAHTVNLAAQRGLQVDTAKVLLARVRKVVGFFHRSSTANAILKSKQEQLQLPNHKLIADVVTRWNSSYDMIQRYLNQQPAIMATLVDPTVRKNLRDVDTMSEKDITNLEYLVEILKPLKDITNVLCDEKLPTVSLIYPLKEKLIDSVKQLDNDSGLVKQVKLAIRTDMEKRYKDEQVEEFLLISSVLDPRFKCMPQISEEKRYEIYTTLANKAAQCVKLDRHETMPADEEFEDTSRRTTTPELEPIPFNPVPPKDRTTAHVFSQSQSESTRTESKCKSAIKNLLTDVFVLHNEPSTKSNLESAVEEISAYRKEERIPLDADPLLWWKLKQYKYPMISRLAKYHLGIPGTSVPSERVFSTAGDIVTAQRASLDKDNVNMLVFLKKNLKLKD